jgi:hypothetical protein
MQRTVEDILTDWRQAEAERAAGPDPLIEARIERLRQEHADAVALLQDEADDLARPPGLRLPTEA